MWKGGLGRKGTGNRFGREIRVSEGYSNLNALYNTCMTLSKNQLLNVICPPHICYGCLLGVFVKLLTVGMQVSLILLIAFGILFSPKGLPCPALI